MASIWLQNMVGYFVLGHYQFLEAHSFPRALLENCSLLRLLRTDNQSADKYPCILWRQMQTIVLILRVV